MAVEEIRIEFDNIGRWTCLSGDTKPTPADAERVGSECWETDTGDIYAWDGANWHPIAVDAVPLSMLADPSDSTRRQEFDPLFKAPLAIDIAHHEIHEGDMFVHNIYDEDAASGHSVQVFLLTPAVASPQKHMHLVASYEGSGEHLYEVTEGCTYSSGGTALTPTNRHRGSANTTSAQSAYTGSDKGSDLIVVTGGTTIFGSWTGQGKNTGGSSRDSEEWVLAPNTGYLFELESKAAGTLIELQVLWYEHSDG